MSDSIENKGKGAIPDFHDSRDYKYSDVAKVSTPFDWLLGFDIEAEIGKKLTVKDQDGSSSCGGQAWAYYGQVLDKDHDEKSAKFIYNHTNAPGGGSAGRTNCQFVINTGWGTEAMTTSYDNGKPAGEPFYLKKDIKSEAYGQAMQDKALSYAEVNTHDIDELAQAIRDNKGVVIGIEGENNGTWRSEFPKPPKDSKDNWRHWIFCGKAKLIDGKKHIGFINSWGNIGANGWQWIKADYLPYTFGGWTLLYNDKKLLLATLKLGSKGEQVKILQEKLGIKVDGIFGKQTEGAVKEFQKNSGLVADGIVGPKTRLVLNSL